MVNVAPIQGYILLRMHLLWCTSCVCRMHRSAAPPPPRSHAATQHKFPVMKAKQKRALESAFLSSIIDLALTCTRFINRAVTVATKQRTKPKPRRSRNRERESFSIHSQSERPKYIVPIVPVATVLVPPLYIPRHKRLSRSLLSRYIRSPDYIQSYHV